MAEPPQDARPGLGQRLLAGARLGLIVILWLLLLVPMALVALADHLWSRARGRR